MMKDKLNRNKKGQITGLLSPFLEKLRMSKVIPWINGKDLLDYGCGSATLLSLLSSDINYVGIDISSEIIEDCKRKFPTAKFYCLNLEKERLPIDNKFDTVVMCAVIEHLSNPDGVLRKVKTILRRGGRLIITTPSPCAEKLLEWGAKLRLFSKEANEEHKKYFSKDDLYNLAKKNNLSVEHYERFAFGFNQLLVSKKTNE